MTKANELVLAVTVATTALSAFHAVAQDVPGIEICTVEKTMVRRTSCLQSNIDFLMKTMNQASRDGQQRLDAANRQIEALKSSVAALEKSVTDLKAAQAKPNTPPPAKKDDKDVDKDKAK